MSEIKQVDTGLPRDLQGGNSLPIRGLLEGSSFQQIKITSTILITFFLAIIYVPNSEILAQNTYKKKEENLPSKNKTAVSRAGEAGKPVNPKNDTLDDVLDKAAEVLEKVAQSQEAGNESHNSNRNQFVDFDAEKAVIEQSLFN